METLRVKDQKLLNQQREQLQKDVDTYLRNGGTIQEIKQGTSAVVIDKLKFKYTRRDPKTMYF